MDAGIATQANLDWLVEHGYRYLVVRRGGARQFDDAKALSIETKGGAKLRLHKQLSADGKEDKGSNGVWLSSPPAGHFA